MQATIQFLGTISSETERGFSNSSGFRIAEDPALDGMVARVSLAYNLISSTTEGVPFEAEDFGSSAGSRTFFDIRGGSTLDPEDTISFRAQSSSSNNAPNGSPQSASGSETFLIDLGKGLFVEFQGGAVGGNVGGAGATASSASAEISFTLVPVEFVWDGKEGFVFGDDGNWSDDVAPGPRNTVQLTDSQAKTIAFESGVLTTNARLIVGSGSETTIDLNGSTWQIDPGTITPDADGQFRMAGGILEISDGTLEVFGAARVITDGAIPAQLSLDSGGKLIVRDGDIFTGRGVDSQAAITFINGPGSLIEAQSIGVGEGSGWFVSGGGQVFANQSINIGGEDEPFLSFSGTGDPQDLFAGSTLTVAAGGSLAVGVIDPGSIRFSNGALAVLSDVTVTVGSNVAEGHFAVSDSSLVGGGNFAIGANSLLEVTDSQAGVRQLEAEGGVIDVKSGGQILVDESLSLIGDAFLSADGSLVRAQTLFTASSRIHLTGSSRLHVPGDNALGLIPLDGTKSARMLGGTLLIEAGSIFETPVFALEAGTVLGRGTIVGTVVNNGGSILPGQSPGILTIDGDYLQTGGRISLNGISAIPEPGVSLLLAIATAIFLVRNSQNRSRS